METCFFRGERTPFWVLLATVILTVSMLPAHTTSPARSSPTAVATGPAGAAAAAGSSGSAPIGSSPASVDGAPSAHPYSAPLPAYCSRIGVAEFIPIHLQERQEMLRCAAAVQGAAAARAAALVGSTPSSSNAPMGFGLYNLAMTYDAWDGYVLLFGATGGTGKLNGTQTWSFSGGTWTLRSPATFPESCVGSVLAYDDLDGYVVYFAGGNVGTATNCSSAGETWTYRAGSWSQLTPTKSPSPRVGAAFTNDTPDGYMLLFGGTSASCTACDDTWSFLAGSWTQLSTTTTPANRSGAGMTYDAAAGYVLMFGGSASPCFWGSPYCMIRDTWSFHGGKWSQLSPVGAVPPEPYDDGLVYDAADHVALYTVTDDNYSTEPEIYWSFSGGNWTDLTGGAGYRAGLAPPNRIAEGLAYDWKDGYVVLFGGTSIGYSFHALNDTWNFSKGNWTNLSAPGVWAALLSATPTWTDLGMPVTFSTRIVGPAGTYTYAYRGLPSGCASLNRPSFTCTPTSAGSYSVSVTVTNATGIYSNATTTLNVNPALAFSYLLASPSTVVINNVVGISTGVTGGTAAYAFRFVGLPAGCAGPGGTQDSPSNQFYCYPTRPGAYVLGVNVTDAVGASVVGTTNLTVVGTPPPAPPTILAFSVSPPTITLGGSASFVVVASGSAPLGYAYAALPPGCSSLNTSSLPCTPTSVGGFRTEALVTDPWGQVAYSNVTLLVGNRTGGSLVGTPLGVLAFLASPAVVAAGSTTILEVFVQGGAAPYTYTYSGLPPPCRSISDGSLPCTPTTVGNFSVSVTVVDHGGNRTAGSALLVVTSPPTSPTNPASNAAPVAGPSWAEFSLGVVAASLGVALLAVLLSRREKPRTPSP